MLLGLLGYRFPYTISKKMKTHLKDRSFFVHFIKRYKHGNKHVTARFKEMTEKKF